MKINELRDGQRKVNVEGRIIEKNDAREVRNKYSNDNFRVAESTIEDETGTVTLTLWNEDIDRVRVGDRVAVENGYTKSFRNIVQLNVGKYGVLRIL